MTTNEDLLRAKKQLRKHFSAIRNAIPSDRREEAAKKSAEILIPKLKNFSRVLSFHSARSEIDLSLVNAYLEREGKLCFPCIECHHLTAHIVKKQSDDMVPASFKSFLEPDPKRSPEIALQDIGCVLVPALAFDKYGYRLGYGRGHYDYFLENAPKGLIVWGLGFKEQLAEAELPRDEHDVPVQKTFLF